jgi:membrane-associated phospholipid phosphatase
MDGILDWGVEVVLWLQRASPALDPVFQGLSELGGEAFFLLLVPLLYWCVDRRAGARVALLFLISAHVNAVLKGLAAQPRPFQVDPRVQQLYPASGWGWPSGHTQCAVVAWGYLAWRFRRAWVWAVAGALVALIPLSRLYLGVHFPADVLGGYVVGGALLLAWLRLAPGAEVWLRVQGPGWQLGAVFALAALLMLQSRSGGGYGMVAGAALVGMAVGMLLERRCVGFETAGPWWGRGLRYALGVGVLFGVRLGLKAAFAGLEPALLLRALRYLTLGLVGALAMPWAFVRTKLAEAPQPRP